MVYLSTDRSYRSSAAVVIGCAGSVVVQIQPSKRVLDYADYTGPTLQHELDHTDQEYIPLEISRP